MGQEDMGQEILSPIAALAEILELLEELPDPDDRESVARAVAAYHGVLHS